MFLLGITVCVIVVVIVVVIIFGSLSRWNVCFIRSKSFSLFKLECCCWCLSVKSKLTKSCDTDAFNSLTIDVKFVQLLFKLILIVDGGETFWSLLLLTSTRLVWFVELFKVSFNSVGNNDNVEIAFGKRHVVDASSDIVNVGKLISFFWNSLISSGELAVFAVMEYVSFLLFLDKFDHERNF